MSTILITRPPAQGARLAYELKERFADKIEILLAPIMAPAFLEPDMPKGVFNSLILTSEAGAISAFIMKTACPERLPNFAFCVGERTADVVKENGFEAIFSKGNSDDLIHLICSHKNQAPFLYLRGQESQGDICARLLERNISCTQVITYAQKARSFDAEVEYVLRQSGNVIAPLYSPRSAHLFFERLEEIKPQASLRFIALSENVAAQIPENFNHNTIVVRKPHSEAVFEAISQILGGGCGGDFGVFHK